MESAARKLLESAKKVAPERFELRPAAAHSHPHVDWTAYERMRQVLANLGFRLLGDFEPVGQSDGSMTHPNVVRIFVSHDGVITAAFYRLALRWTFSGVLARIAGGGRGMLDLDTAFTDGTVLETSTAPLVGRWQSPPFLLKEYQPQMHPGALLARHVERIAEQMQWNPAAQPYRLSTIEQVVAMNQDTTRRKRQFRQSIGWITRDELASYGKLQPAQLDQLHAEIRRLVAMESPAAPAPPPVWTPPSAPPVAAADAPPSAPPAARADAPPPAPASREPAPPTSAEPAGPVEGLSAPPRFAGASVDRPPTLAAEESPAAAAPVEAGRDVASTSEGSGEPAAADEPPLAGSGVTFDRPAQPTQRTLEDVVGRALVMNALVNLHFRAPVEVVRRWIEANGAAPHLSPRERALVAKANAEVTADERAGLRGYIEGLWALLWAGGVADGLAPGQPVPGHMASLVPSLKANEDASALRQRMRLRSRDEVAAMRGRYERVHSSILDGAMLPGVNPDVVKERRKTLEWLANPGLAWDELDA
ncbi:MAG TPA: DUF4272 domain-containing protein [Longimicrobium sp.]|nr:DUF4272 domain-containing protein [Longimicrobium sp.]